ncbi:MAG: hypothetical protein ACK40M_04280 [Flavobacteriales bacterium]
MLKGSKDARRKKFIKLMVAVDDIKGMIEAYKMSYPTCKKDETARVGAYVLLRDPTIVAEIDRLKKKREELIAEAEREEIQRLAKQRIASEAELDAVLSDIALGKYRQPTTVVKYDSREGRFVTYNVDEAPDPAAMASAADKLYKRKGSYKPVTIQHEGGDTFIEFMKSLANVKNKNIPNAIQPGSDK